MRRFPPPWIVEALDGGFKIVDGNGQTLAYVCGHVDQCDAAIGFAQVARIKSANPGSGGSRPSLGGGSAAKASTQTGGTAASSGPSQSVFINVQGKSRFTVDEVNDLMEQLIERQRDGTQLVLVR